MITNRMELLSVEVWRQLAAASAQAQRAVAAQMLEMATITGGAFDGLPEIRAALMAGAYGDSGLRTWVKQVRDKFTADELDAEQLDDDKAAADKAWAAARLYETAYYTLDAPTQQRPLVRRPTR
ncbi:hypothetical protein [Fodinicola feengrottensis]|uniref:hypothetical protein n=1 Tax=Fodinicola feengrottensis TaxID=435914 RepID=UPI0013D634F6|nr:hypothetical protein [Fodinicola feengrottensis]